MNEDLFHLGIKALIMNNIGQVLLLKVNPENLKGYTGEPYWDIPGGRIQFGSNVEDTLKREVEEETGITDLKIIKPFSMILSNIRIPQGKKTVGLILFSYLCESNQLANIKLSKEHIEYKWFYTTEASVLLKVKYTAEFIEKIADLA